MNTQLIQGNAEMLKQDTERHFEAAQALKEAKANLDKRKAEIIAAGIEGKNKEERDAKLELALVKHIEDLALFQAAYDKASLHLTLATIDWDSTKYQVRLLEALKH